MLDAKSLWPLTKESVSQWSEDYAPSMGAALAYYTIFSIAPLIIIAIAVAGFFFGADAARGEIFAQIARARSATRARARSRGGQEREQTGEGTFAAIAGVVTLLLGATTVFGELQSDLDRIWDAPKPEQSGLWGMLRGRLLSFGMMLGIGFLLLVSLVLSAGLSALAHFWSGWFAGWEVRAAGGQFLVGFAVVTGLFAMIYKLLPRCRIGWKDVWIGAMRDVAAVLDRQVADRPVSRQEQRRVGLRRRGIARHRAAVGLLLVADLPARRRVHEDVRVSPRQPQGTGAACARHGAGRNGEKGGAGQRRGQAGHGRRTDGGSGSGKAAPPGSPAPDRSPKPAYARLRIAAGVAAAIGLVAGEVLNEFRRDRSRLARRS